MSQAKRQKIKYGDPTDYNKAVESGAIIPRTPSKTSDELKADIKKGYLVPRPGQADTHLSHLNFSHEAILNAAALDSQEKIARRYYEANIDMINATRKSAGLAELTVDEAVQAAKAVYDVLNDKGKESEELKKDIEAGVIIYRRVNKDLEEEVLAKDVLAPGGSIFITTTTTSTTTIGSNPTGGVAAPETERSARERRSTTEERTAAPEASGSTATEQTGGTPNKKNKGDQSSETVVATELPHVAPNHGTTETGHAGEGARPNSGRVEETNNGGTEAPAPVQPPVVTPEVPAPTVTPQPSAPAESSPTPAPETEVTPTPSPEVVPEAPVVTPEPPKSEPQPKPPVENTNPVTPQPGAPQPPVETPNPAQPEPEVESEVSTPTVPETSVPTPEPPVESNPVQPPSQPEDSVVTPAPEPETNHPVQPESPVENTPAPEVPHVETEEEKLAKYTYDDFSSSTASWYDLEHPETFYNLLPADADIRLERGKTYRLVAWNTTTNVAEYVTVTHPKDLLSEHIHANSTDYTVRPQDKPVPGGPYKDIVTIDWNTLNELDDNALLHEYTGALYYTSNQDLIPVFNHTKGLIWYDFDNVATTYDVDDSNAVSYLTTEFKVDVRKTGTEEIIYYTMPILAQVFTQKVEYDGKTYWIRPQDNYTDAEHVKDIVMLDASKLNEALTNNIGDVNKAFTVVSNRVLHVETDEEKLAKYVEDDFSANQTWYDLDNVHTIYMIHNDDASKVIERGKTYKLVMWNSATSKAEYVNFKHIADVFTETVHANEVDYCVRPQDKYVEGGPEKDIIVFEKATYYQMADQTLGSMVGIVYISHTANIAPTVYTYDSELKWYDLNNPSHVYLVPDTYAYNNLLEHAELTVKDKATDTETMLTIPNPNEVFTKEIEYDGKTYVMRPEDEYTEGGVEKDIVIVDKSMIAGFAVYLQSVLNTLKVVSNKALVHKEESAEDPNNPVVNGKKLSEYTEDEFDPAVYFFDLEAPAGVDGKLYTLKADTAKPFDLNEAHDLVMMEATSKKVKLVHIDPILTTFTHEVKTQSELDIMLRPQDAYVSGVTRDVVYIDKGVKDEARTVAGFMYYVSTDSMTNLKPYEAPANTETSPEATPGNSETSPAPTPEVGGSGSTENPNDRVINGKKVSEYEYSEFDTSDAISIPEDPDEPYCLRSVDYNLEIPAGGSIEVIAVGRNSGENKVITIADPKTVFTKKVTYGGEECYIRPEDVYDGQNSKNILVVPKDFIGICPTTLGNYMRNSGGVYTISNSDVTVVSEAPTSEEAPTPGHTEASPSPTPEHNTENTPNTPAESDPSDPVIHGKKLSEYTTDDFDQSGSLIVPEDTSEEYLVLEADLDSVFEPGESKEILGMPKYSGDKAKMLTVKDPRAVYTKKMLDGRIEVFIRPEDVYDGTTNKSIAYLSSTHHLGDGNITLRDILSGDISTLHNKNLTEPVAPAESQPAPVTPAPEAPKNNEIDYSGRDLYKIVNGDYVFLDGSEISYGGEHDNLGNLDNPYDMSSERNIATPYNNIPMEKLVNKNIVVYSSASGGKEVFMFPDLQYIFSTEVRDNWGNTYLIRSEDLHTDDGESRPIYAINKTMLGERYLYSLTPHELLYNGPLEVRQNDELHQ